jgi:hypothetical protein
VLIKRLGYDQGEENNAMLDEQNYGRREHLEEKKDQHNMEMLCAQSQRCLCNATATLTADPLCRTDSLPESEQPRCHCRDDEPLDLERLKLLSQLL